MLDSVTLNRYTFCARFDRSFSFSPFGAYKYQNGTQYAGAWLDGKRHGQGIFFYNTGHFYIGSWKKNMKHGKGVIFFPNGSYYIGLWEEDTRVKNFSEENFVFECDNQLQSCSCSICKLGSQNNAKRGNNDKNGTQSTPQYCTSKLKSILESELDGNSHCVPFERQQLYLIRTKMGRYEGNLVMGMKHGWGFFAWNNEQQDFHSCELFPEDQLTPLSTPSMLSRYKKDHLMYAGQWALNQIEGFGICWYPDGKLYSGNWFEGKSNGIGSLYDPLEGLVSFGHWHRGKELSVKQSIMTLQDSESFKIYMKKEFLYSSFKLYGKLSIV